MHSEADAALAAKVNAYMAEKPRATRNDLRHACNTSQPKLEKLEKLGLIQLPRKLSPSEIGRKAVQFHSPAYHPASAGRGIRGTGDEA